MTSKVLGQVAGKAPELVIIPQSDGAAGVFREALFLATKKKQDPQAAYNAALANAKRLSAN